MNTNDFLQQDVFFFITTVAVVVLAVFLGMFFFRLIRIMGKIEYLVDKTKSHAELVGGAIGSFLKLRKRK